MRRPTPVTARATRKASLRAPEGPAFWAGRLEAACQERGLPVTVQRRVVLTTLAERRDHPTAECLFADVAARLPGVARATVYRTLDALVELGLAARLPSPSGAARFEARRTRHDHAHCLQCGRVEDLLAPAPGGDAPRGPRGFVIQDWSTHLLGTCAQCRAAGLT